MEFALPAEAKSPPSGSPKQAEWSLKRHMMRKTSPTPIVAVNNGNEGGLPHCVISISPSLT